MEKSLKKLALILLIMLLLVVGAIWSELPLRDAVSMQPLTNFTLYFDMYYLLLAPWLNILDLMGALSLTQHMAWILSLWLLGIYTSFKLVRYYKPHLHQLWVGLIALFLGFVAMLFIYVVAMLVPRPMATLVVPEQDMLVVDFHSHTDASHDANKSFDAEDNRWWHEYAGFDAVFVTDHSTFEGIEVGKANNADQAKDGVQLMDGVEVFHKGGHILALCAKHIVQKKKEYLWQKHSDEACEPLLVQALPAPMSDSDARFREREIQAIEINDGAPLGLEEIKYRKYLIAMAKRLNISVVSGSDNHGWAYTAVGWSVLRIQGWKTMGANQLALAITNKIRKHGFTAVQVVERNTLLPAITIYDHIMMPFKLVWHMFQTLSWAERLSWLVWLLLLAILRLKTGRLRSASC